MKKVKIRVMKMNQDRTSDRVGISINKDDIKVTFPYHYFKDEQEKNLKKSRNNKEIFKDIYLKDEYKDIKLLIQVFVKYYKQKGESLKKESEENSVFPIFHYLEICKYYDKYGFYKKRGKNIKKSSKGKIDWKKTFVKSERIYTEDGIFFKNLYSKSIDEKEIFITECMKYVLSEGYNNFGKYFGIGIRFNGKINDKIFLNPLLVIKKLKIYSGQLFKDYEVRLINNLIGYFEGEDRIGNDKIGLSTNRFENIWEKMVGEYIQKNVAEFGLPEKAVLENEKKIKFGSTKNKGIKKNSNNEEYFFVFDHYYEEKDEVYLYDSKYYKIINHLNEKQVLYHYFLTNVENKKILENRLILPKNKNYTLEKRVHIEFDVMSENNEKGIIEEMYLDIKKVMEEYIKE
jgi:llaI.3 like protein